MTSQNTDTRWAFQVLVAVKKRGLYAHNVIQASHGRSVFEKTGNLAEWRTRLMEAAIADGLPENEIPKP